LNEKFDSDLPNFVSGSDWEAGYCLDNWRTDLNDGVMANRDDSCPDCGCDFQVQSDGGNPCLGSDPFDNHIQTGSRHWQNYVYSVKFRNSDNDALGVVFRYRDSDTFYLFVLSRSSFPAGSTGCDETFSGAQLIRVRGETGPTVLLSLPGFTYTENQIHSIRVTADKNHIKVEFDQNGDGQFGPDEVFFDQNDELSQAIPAGGVGLYAFNNGVTESDGQSAPCADTGCWFDDVVVDLLPANDVDCAGYAWEGACEEGDLKWCDLNGKLQTDTCDEGFCCKWIAGEQFYTCVPQGQCTADCVDQCATGQTGCSANLTHLFTCGQGDDDPCLEPLFSACPAGHICIPEVGSCVEQCIPDCNGKVCGDDGCGQSCGECPAETTCQGGQCAAAQLGKMGDPCETNLDCISMMCVISAVGPICSKACGGDSSCPPIFDCEEVTIGQATILACVPNGECISDCEGKECGSDGCTGSCGTCPQGFSCDAGQCKSDAGASCETGQDCASGLCISFQSGTMCSVPCSTDAGCPDGWKCGPWLSADVQHLCAPPSTMTAHEDCKDIAQCVSGCPAASNACKASCFFFGTTQAQEDYAPLWWCAETNCFETCPELGEECLESCILDLCFQEFALCWPGTTTCQQAFQCVSACEGNSGCADQCYDSALPAAKGQLLALLDCVGALCPPGTGGDCFVAAVAEACKDPYEACSDTCSPVCGEAVCGDDGCGGLCGECDVGLECKQGECIVACVPDCDGKECGEDGCSGQCGACAQGEYCAVDTCAPEGVCIDNAQQKCQGDSLYWFDSCETQQEMVEECPYGCLDGACLGAPVADLTAQPDTHDEEGVKEEPIIMSAGEKNSGGCSQTSQGATQPQAWLLALLLAALLAVRKSRRAHA
jgi:MYXO-CTERM domain-containing protein